jgi:hypothetical protein
MMQRPAGQLLGIFGVVFLGACTPQKPAADSDETEKSLAAFEVERVPETVENRLYADFEGKVQLLGYDLSPHDLAPPGSKVNMTLYWQRTGRLGPGWGLFTHVLDENGRQLAQRDNSGPLRTASGDGAQALGPSAWGLGKIYRDELEFDIPREAPRGEETVPLTARRVTIALGVWKGARTEDPGGAARLDVIGHPSDEHRRALVAHLKTGVEPPKPEATAETGEANQPEKPQPTRPAKPTRKPDSH